MNASTKKLVNFKNGTCFLRYEESVYDQECDTWNKDVLEIIHQVFYPLPLLTCFRL